MTDFDIQFCIYLHKTKKSIEVIVLIRFLFTKINLYLQKKPVLKKNTGLINLAAAYSPTFTQYHRRWRA